MGRHAACPYAKAGEGPLTAVEHRLWGELRTQISGFYDEVSAFMNSFDNSHPHEEATVPVSATEPAPLTFFSWGVDDVALSMQAAVFATSGRFISWDNALKRAHDFGVVQKDDATPPDNNSLGLFVQPTTATPRLTKPALSAHAHAAQTTSRSIVTPAPPPQPPAKSPPQPPAKSWAEVAAPATTTPTPVRGGSMPVRNTAAIQKELTQIKAQKMSTTNGNTEQQDEEGWNVRGKGKKNKATPAVNSSLPASVLPIRKADAGKNKQTPNLEVAFKPTSPIDVDLVKARANQMESRSCLMRLLKHCNELTASKEYKDKTDIRVKSFSYSRNGNCIAVFTPKTNIKEVELFAPGLCGVMGLKGDVTVQHTSGWTRMRVLHFPAWATDPDTREWIERINSKEEILSILKDFAPRDLLTKFPPVDVRFFKPDAVTTPLARPWRPTPRPASLSDTATPSSQRTRPGPGSRSAKGAVRTSAPGRKPAAPQCGAISAVSAMTPRITTLGAASAALRRWWTNPDTFARAPHGAQTARVATSSATRSAQAGLNMRQYAPPLPWTTTRRRVRSAQRCRSTRTSPCPPLMINTPALMAASTQAPQPPALAENGLISREIMQVNAVKSNTRIHALLASPTYNDISILIISNPWWGPIGTAKHDTNDQHRLLGAPANPLWRCYTPPIDTQNTASPPSCVVYIRKDRGVTAEIDPLAPATPFFFVLDIFINGFLFKLIPVYLHGPKHAEAARDLFQLPVVETPTLICGDFNIQHPDFFADWLLDGDLHVLNDLHHPTREPRVRGHTPSIIDFSIANGALFSLDILADWDSSFAHSLDSDHAAIFFTIHVPRTLEWPATHYCYVIDPLMEEEWSAAFGQRVLELGLTGQVSTTLEVETLASGILGVCTWATEAVMESRPTQRKAPWVPWWDEDCSAACSQVVKAKEERLNREEIRTHTSHLWYCIHKAKRSFFDEVCSTARPDNIWSINQWYRGRKSHGLPTLRKPDGTLATTNSEKSEVLHSTFFPFTPGQPTGASIEAVTQHDELAFPPISWSEIATNLASCSNKSAPGAHGTNYWVLRWAFAVRGDLIEALYNAMLTLEYHPACLKNALITPIPKPNKFDFASPKAYRPISLLETLSKLFEKIMAARFTALSGLHGLIPPEQFGGRDMTSCMDAGLSLIHDIEHAWARKQQASVTLLDISGYFNNINHRLLVKCMRKMGYPTRVLALRSRGVQVRAYIDDLCIFAQSDTQEGCIASLLDGTRATLDALEDMGLCAEASKTELIHFAKSARDMTKNLPLILGDRAKDIIRGANTVRWLGFFLDRRLNFKDHVSRMATRAKCILGGMRMLGNNLRGLSVYHVRMLVNACIVPILTYSFALWFHGRNSKTHCKTLQTVQNLACRWASGSFRTAPVAVVEHTIAMPPIAFRIRRQCANYSAKLRHLPSSSQVCARLPQGFRTSTPDLASTARFSPINALAAYTSPDAEARTPYLLMPWEGVKQLGEDRLTVSMPRCSSDSQKKAYALALQSRIADLSQKVGVATLYTDGACFSRDGRRHTGWGLCLMLGDSKIDHSGGALGPNHTSYDAECHAVADGIARVARLADQTPLYLLHVVSDNAGMLQGLLSPKPKGAPSSVDWAARELCDLTSRHQLLDLLLSWCPAHHRVPGNKRADAIAKRRAVTTPSPTFAVSTDRIRWEAKERLVADWKAHWQDFKDKHPNSMGTLAVLNSPWLRLHPFHTGMGGTTCTSSGVARSTRRSAHAATRSKTRRTS
ncbi:Reverse transcriptase from mobile element jockey protein [Ceratobasidium theobromae]|uniref:Reverse transcriptase from mobile element jockey protein n=1 Tax=Ceratobasidium theobromae TaxID=1582974 RepID=A0A5N5Q958_9AGAM|nr:Reverse transcriptase from mobile element jockey protein [Ceratobasidium theobromae]